MPKVRAFEIAGLDIKFYTRYEHDPAHFHVVKPGAWEIAVNIAESTEAGLDYGMRWVKNRTGPTASELRAILASVIAHQHELIAEWDETRPR